MKLKNRVQLIGNVGATPNVRVFESGKKMARFSVATTDVYKRDGKLVKDTQWHNVTAWGKTAEIVENNLLIGTEVVIDGRIINNTFNDRNGETRKISEILAESLLFRNIKSAIEKSKSDDNQQRA